MTPLPPPHRVDAEQDVGSLARLEVEDDPRLPWRLEPRVVVLRRHVRAVRVRRVDGVDSFWNYGKYTCTRAHGKSLHVADETCEFCSLPQSENGVYLRT